MDEFVELQNGKKHTFHIKGKVNDKKVEGDFTCKYPSIMDQVAINATATGLLKGADPSILGQNIVDQAYNLAACKVLIIESPDWFNLETLDDIETLNEIVKEMAAYAKTFRQEDGEGEPGQASDQ